MIHAAVRGCLCGAAVFLQISSNFFDFFPIDWEKIKDDVSVFDTTAELPPAAKMIY